MRLRTGSLTLVFGLIMSLLSPAAVLAQASALTLIPLGTHATGVLDSGAAEIVAYDPETARAFVVNAASATIDILDISDPTAPIQVGAIDVTPYGGQANSVAVHDRLLAAAIEAEDKQANGHIVFFTTDGEFLNQVETGPQPDMITFTPEGTKVLTANEGEPNDDYSVDPEGSITIVDLTDGVKTLTQEHVTTVGFTAFNDIELDPAIRIFGPGATVAQDLEPEYIAVAPDSRTAWVTLQENNALAVLDLTTNQVIALLPLGYKDYNRPQADLTTIEISDLPVLGTTTAGQEILLGGFSGLFYEGVNPANGRLIFTTHPDRGPNAEPVDVDGDGIEERPFPLPDFQTRLVRLEVDLQSGAAFVTDEILLQRANGMPITGLPNLVGDPGMAYADEKPVDLLGNPLLLDPYGGDFEGIVRADDGSYWMVDEYRPAIYHFTSDGVLIDRFVPEGTNAEGDELGTEALPAIFAQRRANRGFEAVAYSNGYLYAFIQSPLDNPDTPNDASSKGSNIVRILEFDTTRNETTGQYIYLLDGDGVDKIGDAVALNSHEFLVIERDSATGSGARKYIYKIDISSATNIHGRDDLPVHANQGLERQERLGLAVAGIQPVQKQLYVDLGTLGYNQVDKPEGLALIDENTLAVINDNDFRLSGTFDLATGLLTDNPTPQPILLGIIHLRSNGLDASDKDEAIHIRPWPILGMYQPDAIAAYQANDGQVYLITANEGDARDYQGFSEEVRVEDLVLDLAHFPNATWLQAPNNLGRLRVSIANGDMDGDGLYEALYSFGGRSFAIWSADGQLIYDSGDQLARLTAERLPEGFNSDSENNSFDSRSDDKGIEPEALALGQIDGRTIAFIGLERIGGIVLVDVTDPTAPTVLDYVNLRDFQAPTEKAGDLAPEGLVFIPAETSPIGQPLLLVANEFSGTTSIFLVTHSD